METRSNAVFWTLATACAPALALADDGSCGGGPGWFAWLLTIVVIVGAAVFFKGAVERNTELLLTIDDDVRTLLTKVSRLGESEGPQPEPPTVETQAPRAAKKKAAPKKK